jgi:uncharacterized membrane protein YkoI
MSAKCQLRRPSLPEMTRALALPLLVALGLVSLPALSLADDDKMDRLSAAVARGEVRPLSDLLEALKGPFPGKVVEVEIDEEDDVPGGFVYEFKILQENGRLLEIELEAATGAVIEVDGF